MKVLHVGKFYPPARGGMERVVQLLCEGERAFVDSSVLAANDAPVTVRENVNGVPVTRAATFATIGSVGVSPSFPFWMRRLPCDVMVIHEPNPLALVAHAIARPRARLIVWFHSEVVRPRWKYRVMYRPFLRRVLHLADRIVVASPRLAEFAEELKDFRHKCVPIPFGLDLTPLDLTEEVERRVLDIRVQHPAPLALFVGRMVPYKGVDVLIRALTEVNVRVILVGDGPERAAWQQLAGDLGLSSRVHFWGEVPQTVLTSLYHACDFFVLPSVTRAEAFGMVQLEAMACGKPVISTLLPTGVPWVNRDRETGLVVQPQNVPALRAALARLAGDAKLRAEMGALGRARVLSDFTVPRMIERTTTLYGSIVAPPVAARRAALADTAASTR
nr:D-inositol-3-phosphate glycosyltransferase [uncultured bacterium]